MSLFPHVRTAIHLAKARKSLINGDNIYSVYTNTYHKLLVILHIQTHVKVIEQPMETIASPLGCLLISLSGMTPSR
jgi:hypothetical protein